MASATSVNFRIYLVAVVLCLQVFWAVTAEAIPVFSRKYGVSCSTCHSAVPSLNSFGEQFISDNLKMPHWKATTINGGDDMLALPSQTPLAMRVQAYVQARDGESIDPITGETEKATTDFQTPYLVKLLSSAPLSENISYYVYAIFAEKGTNGEVIVEDAWFRHADLFNSGVGMQLGQFQTSDLMFPREIRLPFQDFMIYRMAGITYDRGVLFDRSFNGFDFGIGLVNGNGIVENININSPGYRRPDKMFDNDSSKSAFGRVGTDIAGVSVGLFGLLGEQKNASGPAGAEQGNRDTDKMVAGVDVSGSVSGNVNWYGQFLWNRWEDFLVDGINYDWWGLFAGVDYIYSDRWVFSTLYNFADANDFDGTDTIYEGIDINTLSFTSSYYFMRNVKAVVEVNFDLQSEENQTGMFFTGHLSNENYVLLGFDAAF